MPVRHLCALVVACAMLALVACGERRREREVVVVHDAPPPPPGEEVVVVHDAPPPERVEVITVAPSPEHVWIRGYWAWRGGWVWMPGHWERPPPPGAECGPRHAVAT